MEKIYQISVKGSYTGFSDDVFKASSKKVYRHYPTQEDIDEFINKCKTPVSDDPLAEMCCLDGNKHYSVNILELSLND